MSRNAFSTEFRPWVSVKSKISGPLFWNENGANISINFHLENLGRTPALSVFVHWRLIVLGGVINIPEVQRETMDVARRSIGHLGVVVFPGEQVDLPMGTNVSRPEIDKFSQSMIEKGWTARSFSPLGVVGCVAYRSSLTEEINFTGFSYEISSIPGVNPGGDSPTVDVDVPISNLVLRNNAFIYDAAFAS
ncbi:hypothetical protein [Burkholderia cepacia]|uniref:hypothetical protein n=1 Tax=Burkholderia cepacia TaxID=292 RepID=UPI00398F1062